MKKLLSSGILLLTFALFNAAAQENEIVPFQDENTGLYGYNNPATGQIVIEAQFNNADFFNEGLAIVGKDNKWGYINTIGKPVIPIIYAKADYFYDDLAAVQEYGGKIGFIDKTGKTIIPFQFAEADGFEQGVAVVAKNGENNMLFYGLIDKTGKTVADFKFTLIDNFFEDLAAASTADGKFGFINRTGQIAIPCKYEGVRMFSEGYAAVKKDGNWGFINKAGNEVIFFGFDEAADFAEGLAAVKMGGYWGFIDNQGKQTIPFKYVDAGYFSEGKCSIPTEDEILVIDKSGNILERTAKAEEEEGDDYEIDEWDF